MTLEPLSPEAELSALNQPQKASPDPIPLETEGPDSSSGHEATDAQLESDGQPITLVVGERRFATYRMTLTGESEFFKALLTNPYWDRPQSDGFYFIDQDGDIFVHILRYLRSNSFPVFYDSANGHDHGMYHSLLAQARYFQIQALEDYLSKQKYETEAQTVYSTKILEGEELLRNRLNIVTGTLHEVHPAWITKKIYICPRGIPCHRDSPEKCGQACKKAQGAADNEYEEEHLLSTVMITKTTMFQG